MSIRVLDTSVYLLNMRTRMPFRYGITTLTALPHLFLQATVEIDGRRQAVQAFEFLRTVPGFEKSYIVDLPPQLGIRETRRVIGGYMLSGEDVLGCASFDDSIGVNGWPMEQHVAGDVTFTFPPIPESRGFNELPYRMLVPEGIDNLLVAGRCAELELLTTGSADFHGPDHPLFSRFRAFALHGIEPRLGPIAH